MKDLKKLRYHQLNIQVVEQQTILRNQTNSCSCFKALICFILTVVSLCIIGFFVHQFSESKKLNNNVVLIQSGHNGTFEIIKGQKIENPEKKRTFLSNGQKPAKESEANLAGIAIGHFVDNLFNPKNEEDEISEESKVLEHKFDEKIVTNKPENEANENVKPYINKEVKPPTKINIDNLFVKPKIEENHIQCNDIVPGINRMARGVDITTLDLFPSNLWNDNGFGSKLFEFTCQKTRRWTHPTTKNQYTLPDQIATINTLPAGSMSIKTKFNHNLLEYKQSLAAQVGLDISNGPGGCFSQSACYKEAKERILKSNQSISEASAYISDIQIDFQPSEEMYLSQQFRNYIEKKLTDKYENGAEAYNKFIETFGTHYFERAHFGGYLQQKTLIDNEYLYKTDQLQLSESSRAKIMPFLSKNKTKRSLEDSKTFTHFFGGVADLSKQYNNNNDGNFMSKWIDSVYQNPWLFAGKLVPIENLIKNQTIKRELQKAISQYRVNAYLKDFKDVIVLNKIKLTERGAAILESIDRDIKNPQPEAIVNNFSKSIDSLFARTQEAKDHELLREYYTKMYKFWYNTFSCKYLVATSCKTSPMADELQKQNDEYNQLWNDKILKLYNQDEAPNSKLVLELVQEAAKFMHDHETTVVDLCQGCDDCQKCVKLKADCLYSEEIVPEMMTCKTPASWRIIQYIPQKRNITYENGVRLCH